MSLKVKDKRLTRNAARCKKCGAVLESKHVHDFASCPCGNFIDGGLEYERGGGNPDEMENLCEYEEYERAPFPHELRTDQSGAFPETLREAEQGLRHALANVSVHSAFLPGAPRELLEALLKRCGEIARAALERPRPAPPEPSEEAKRAAEKAYWEASQRSDARRSAEVPLHVALEAAYAVDFGGTAGTGAAPPDALLRRAIEALEGHTGTHNVSCTCWDCETVKVLRGGAAQLPPSAPESKP